MSVENVKSFFKRLEEDEAFRDEFAKSGTLEKGNRESILKAAAEAGYGFTADDLEEAKKDTLTDEQLDKVAGGVDLGWGACFIVGFGVNSEEMNDDYTENGFCLTLGVVY